MIELILSSLLSASGIAVAETADEKPSAERKICKSAVKTETRIDAHRVCCTRSEWKFLEASPAVRAKMASKAGSDETHELDAFFNIMMKPPALKDQSDIAGKGGPSPR